MEESGFAWEGPRGYSARQPTRSDIPELCRLVNQAVESTLDMAYVTETDLSGGWDDERATLGLVVVFDEEEAVAYASPIDDEPASCCYFDLFAVPGTPTAVIDAVIRWVGEGASIRGLRKVASAADAEAILARFLAAGYEVVHEEVAMFLDLAGAPAPEWPPGVHPKPFIEGQDELLMFETMKRGFGSDFRGEFETWIQRHQSDRRYDPALWFFAADGAEHVGAVQCRRYWGAAEDTGWLNNVAVLPEARRRGIGRALVLEAAARFKERRAERMVLGVSLENSTDAVAFYERMGLRRGRAVGRDLEKPL